MAQPPDKKAEKSYLYSAVDSLNPWAASRGSGSATPEPPPTPPPGPAPSPGPTDHSTNSLYGISRRNYPPDCPPLKVLWFHAVDVPKRKPAFLTARRNKPAVKEKPPVLPKKYAAFVPSDSRAIEEAYQTLLEEREDSSRDSSSFRRRAGTGSSDILPSSSTHVPVNEDFLFDVAILQRELAPVYWLGPVYDVRRGTWFYQEGSNLRPCEENLASQLEDGYLKTKPWLISTAQTSAERDDQRDRSDSSSTNPTSKDVTSADASTTPAKSAGAVASPQLPSYRLFGSYMNSVATYQDENTAWLSSDGILSWVTSTVYQRFAGGGYMSGVKLVRGYSEPGKAKDSAKRPQTPTDSSTRDVLDEKQQKALKRKSAPPSTKAPLIKEPETHNTPSYQQGSALGRSSDKLEEEIRRRQEQEISGDYSPEHEDTQGREIEHLVLVTHGIGQLLSLRLESMSFIHDVNVMRKTMKSVYSSSADLKALNGEFGEKAGNCKVQVLPICWRHHLDFPKQREVKREQDIGLTNVDEDAYPALEDITVEGVAFARSMISDFALDVLLYQSGYREQIMTIVLSEANRIYSLFKERNPGFQGKVHLTGHSLGSAILFDLLCRQKEKEENTQRKIFGIWPSSPPKPAPERSSSELSFDFEVADFYCLGSPVGLFQMVKGRTISARGSPHSRAAQSPLDPDLIDDPFNAYADQRLSPVTGLPFSVSSPRVSQLFNIIHPSDPISYRLEPLIAPAMSTLKPQVLPYTKKGIFSSMTPQGLSGIGAMVGQSVSGLWSSLSAGVTSGLLNRSLGLSSEDVARITDATAAEQDQKTETGPSTSTGGVIPDTSVLGKRTDQRKMELADPANTAGRTSLSGNDATLIDYDLETLYSKFEKARASGAESSTPADELEKKARKMSAEEAKVRALNRNGRVDYSIQESVLDYNPINTIASHLSYWGDEDVNHFMLSQLLSSKVRTKST